MDDDAQAVGKSAEDIEEYTHRLWPFPADELEQHELTAIPEMQDKQQSQFDIRNEILNLWHRNARIYITPHHLKDVDIPEEDKPYVPIVLAFLEQHGYVNHGLLQYPENSLRLSLDPKAPSQRKVIVIGAGFSGLSCAHHLQRMGYNVTVVEARNRVGGRCHTEKSTGHAVDLGSMVMLGTHGNPLKAIAEQLKFNKHALGQDIPVFDTEGVPVDRSMDDETEDLYDSILQMVNADAAHCAPVSEIHKARLGQQFWNALKSCRTHPPEGIQAQLLNWHIANLEHAHGTDFNDLSVAEWDQVSRDLYGDPCVLSEGWQTVAEKLANQLKDLRLQHIVTDVNYVNENGNPKAIVSLDRGEPLIGDAVVCTVPLGVLKKGTISFTPPLPAEKQNAIERFGYGNVNALSLVYREAWWMPELECHSLGLLASEEENRGLGFLLYNLYPSTKKPILVAMMSGQSAWNAETMPEGFLVQKITDHLDRIFVGRRTPQMPIKSFLSKWGQDPFSCGAQSFVAAGSSLKDCMILRKPVDNVLYFAGEATSIRALGTMTAAYSSGLRCAGEIIDHFNPRAILEDIEIQQASLKYYGIDPLQLIKSEDLIKEEEAYEMEEEELEEIGVKKEEEEEIEELGEPKKEEAEYIDEIKDEVKDEDVMLDGDKQSKKRKSSKKADKEPKKVKLPCYMEKTDTLNSILAITACKTAGGEEWVTSNNSSKTMDRKDEPLRGYDLAKGTYRAVDDTPLAKAREKKLQRKLDILLKNDAVKTKRKDPKVVAQLESLKKQLQSGRGSSMATLIQEATPTKAPEPEVKKTAKHALPLHKTAAPELSVPKKPKEPKPKPERPLTDAERRRKEKRDREEERKNKAAELVRKEQFKRGIAGIVKEKLIAHRDALPEFQTDEGFRESAQKIAHRVRALIESKQQRRTNVPLYTLNVEWSKQASSFVTLFIQEVIRVKNPDPEPPLEPANMETDPSQTEYVLSQPAGHDSPPPAPPVDDGVPPPPSDDDGVPPPPSDDDGVPPPPSDDDGVPPPPSDDDGVPPPPSDDDGVPPPPTEDEGGVPDPPQPEEAVPPPSPEEEMYEIQPEEDNPLV